MIRYLALVLILAALNWASLPAIAATPEPAPAKCSGSVLLRDTDFPPPPTDDRGFDILSYDLDFRLDSVSSRITGTVDIGLASLINGLQVVQLDLVDELTCEGITLGELTLSFTHANDALLIDLPFPLALAEAETLRVSWQGRPPRHGHMLVGLLFRHHNSGTLDDPSDDVPIMANISEPWSAHSWWPCKDHPADKALVSMAVTVPDTLRVIGNGSLLSVEEVEPGWQRYRWREEYPLPTYLVSVAASNYESWFEVCPTAHGEVPLEYHIFPQDRVKAEHDLAPTCAMMDFLVDLAGPYPFAGEKYAQVEIKWSGAMEHTTATSLGNILLTGDGRFETIVVHELAHHWFGDSLTPGIWADIWLNEGFARYCEALWVEHAYGPEVYREFMTSIGIERHPNFFTGEGLLGDPDPIMPNILIYNKGAWLLHSLRGLLGDAAFFGFVRDYAADPGLVQGTVGLSDLVRWAESHAGRDLAGFFGPWLETDVVPQVWFEAEAARNNLNAVRVTFHQLQEPVFEMAIPVQLHGDCGTVDKVALLNRRDQVFQWDLGCRLDSITVDPDSMVFMFRGEAPPPPLEVRGPWPNPVSVTGGQFEIYLEEPGHVEASLYDLRGRRVAEYDLGFLEATGPGETKARVPFGWSFQPDMVEPGMAAGVYWVEFVLGNSRVIRKISLVK